MFEELREMLDQKISSEIERGMCDLGIAKMVVFCPKKHEGHRQLINNLIAEFNVLYKEHIGEYPVFIESRSNLDLKPFDLDICMTREIRLNDKPDNNVNIDVQICGVNMDLYCKSDVVGAKIFLDAVYRKYQDELAHHLERNPHAKWDDFK